MQTEEKSHLCEICGKSFRLDSSLKMHIKRHYSDYNFECYLCRHRKTSTYTLRKHMRIHVSGQKIFQFEHKLKFSSFFLASYSHRQDGRKTIHMFALPQELFGTEQSRHTLSAPFRTNEEATQMHDVQRSIHQTRIIVETLCERPWSRYARIVSNKIH